MLGAVQVARGAHFPSHVLRSAWVAWAVAIGALAVCIAVLIRATVAYAFMYQAITLAEEAYLRRKFGAAFDQYCRDVPRWWPRLRGLAATFTRTRFNWARVLVKAYSEPLGWTLPIVLTALYNTDEATGLAERPRGLYARCRARRSRIVRAGGGRAEEDALVGAARSGVVVEYRSL